MNFVTGHEPGDCYGKKTFYRIVKDGSEHAKEVGTNCHYFQFPGQGQKSTPSKVVKTLKNTIGRAGVSTIVFSVYLTSESQNGVWENYIKCNFTSMIDMD